MTDLVFGAVLAAALAVAFALGLYVLFVLLANL